MMKRILLLGCMLMIISGIIQAQDKKYEVKTTPVSKVGANDGKITITILETKSFYIYGLWDKAPWDEGTEITNSGQVKEMSYTFSELKSGTYIVYLQFGDDSGYYETVKVE